MHALSRPHAPARWLVVMWVVLSLLTARGAIVRALGTAPEGLAAGGKVSLAGTMTVSKTAQHSVVPAGNYIRYTIVVANTGQTALTNLHVSDALPLGTYFVNADAGGHETAPGSRVVVWDVATLAVGTSVTLHLTAGTGAGARGIVTNSVTASADDTAPVGASCNVQVVSPIPPTVTPTATATATATATSTATPTATPMCADAFEPNETLATAWPLVPGAIQSYICCLPQGADEDWFKFSAAAKDAIRAELSELPADYALCLYGPDQALIECSRNPATAAEVIERTAPSDGDYYLHVFGGQGACDSLRPYRLDLAVTPPAPAPTPTATATVTPTPTATATPVPGNIEVRVWDDRNRDGVWQDWEQPLAGALVELLEGGLPVAGYRLPVTALSQHDRTEGNRSLVTASSHFATCTTELDGACLFGPLDPGPYGVRVTSPRGFSATTPAEVDLDLLPAQLNIVQFGASQYFIFLPLIRR